MADEYTPRENQVRQSLDELLCKITDVEHYMMPVQKGTGYDFDLPAVGTDLELATVNNLRVEAEKLLFDFENRIKSGGRV
ncbi:hypothetical protein [Methylophaga nitratireducenticrescens]|uniref:hypothetical protein n=1 Tax=Methylophaga nitratireducenticrescens TaxID=754476 RepID=UPI000CDC681E|nr:hypothetical protein [Methylophaga nitratireducenticrescens]AUZ86172.1 hypothetical protein CDW43_16080 [Methylophaga nitratireducenticrescens]